MNFYIYLCSYKGMLSHCKCKTLKGGICKREVRKGENFCWQHKECTTTKIIHHIEKRSLPSPVKIQITYKYYKYKKSIGYKNFPRTSSEDAKGNCYFEECFGKPSKNEAPDLKTYMKNFKSDIVIFYVHDEGVRRREMIGFMGIRRYKNFFDVHAVCIGKKHQGKGYCKLILNTYFGSQPQGNVFYLLVKKGNLAAKKCYENSGFKQVKLPSKDRHILEKTYTVDPNEDIWMMNQR